MLPTSRMNVFFAKLMTIMTAVLGLVALQFIFLHVYRVIVKWIVPQVYRQDLEIVRLYRSSVNLSIILPYTLTDFILSFRNVLLDIFVIFTICLIHNRFRF